MSRESCDQVRDYLFSQTTARGRGGGPPDCVHLDDLTTEGTHKTEYTNSFDWLGLHAHDTSSPDKNVSGLQIDGYFSDEPSRTTLAPGNLFGKRDNNLDSVYRYDAQFVIRFPDPEHWKNRLVITGAPGLRGQYANDHIIADHVLQKGCAFASTDKGNSGLRFYSADRKPGDAVAEWHKRIDQLARVVKEAAEEYYGEELKYTYITGCSNAGYLTRYALENDPADLYDGGVDWQGPLWTDPDEPYSDLEDKGPNLLTFLPQALRFYPLYPIRDARNAMTKAGFEPDQYFLWEYYYNTYWNSTERVYREEFDPYYPGAPADYNYAERISPKNPFASLIKDAVKRVSLTGDVKKPLLTLHGTLDALLPITKSSDRYTELVKEAKKEDVDRYHRYYKIEGGTHVDSLYDYTGPDPKNPDYKLRDKFREELRPILPCYKAAFDRLVEWVEDKTPPPDNQTTPKPTRGDAVNSCPELAK